MSGFVQIRFTTEGRVAWIQLSNVATRNALSEVMRDELKAQEERAIFDGLIRHADVFIQNFRPGVAERMVRASCVSVPKMSVLRISFARSGSKNCAAVPFASCRKSSARRLSRPSCAAWSRR